VPLAIIARMTRSSLLEVLRQEYVMTARSKGLHEWVVVTRHALRNALIPILTITFCEAPLAGSASATISSSPAFSNP
jgi:ABC-type dipeptide/oligopeptide/nickel transport system permease component